MRISPGRSDVGYAVAHAVAADNLRVGRTVVADCVNPWPLTRDEWRTVAEQAGVQLLEVEFVCSDEDEHRRRVELRVADIPGHRVPTWQEVVERDYRPWHRPRLVIDTGRETVEGSVRAVADGPSRHSHDQTANLTEDTQVHLADGTYAIASDCSR
jgi:predicted kinase